MASTRAQTPGTAPENATSASTPSHHDFSTHYYDSRAPNPFRWRSHCPQHLDGIPHEFYDSWGICTFIDFFVIEPLMQQ